MTAETATSDKFCFVLFFISALHNQFGEGKSKDYSLIIFYWVGWQNDNLRQTGLTRVAAGVRVL